MKKKFWRPKKKNTTLRIQKKIGGYRIPPKIKEQKPHWRKLCIVTTLPSSLSPSAKSKGARPSSANTINNIREENRNKKTKKQKEGEISKLRDVDNKKKTQKIKRKSNFKRNALATSTKTPQRGIFRFSYNSSYQRTINRKTNQDKEETRKENWKFKKKKRIR